MRHEDPTARRDGDAGATGRSEDRYALDCVLDDELAPQRAELLRSHLARCPECAAEVERVRRMKELVRRSCCEEPAPQALRERITIEVRRISVTIRTAHDRER